MNHKFIGGALMCLSFTACNMSRPAENKAGITRNGDTVTVAEDSPVIGKLSIETVGKSEYNPSFSTVGTVRAKAGRLAEVGVPFDGRTVHSHVRLGQYVKEGQALFGFHSAEFADLAKEYFQSRSNSELAQKNLERKRMLKERGVVSVRELEEAENAAEVASRELVQSENNLEMLGVNVSTLTRENSLDICSPISGEVVMCEVTTGQFVRTDSGPLVVVADLDEVWVEAHVKEHYLGRIHQEDRAEIRLDSEEGMKEGSIHYIGQILDEQTRSVPVTVACGNADKSLKPGMFVRVRFIAPSEDALIIPSSAVMQGEDTPYVFVSEGDGRFVRRAISIATAEGDKVIVSSGLEEGENIVTSGGIYIGE